MCASKILCYRAHTCSAGRTLQQVCRTKPTGAIMWQPEISRFPGWGVGGQKPSIAEVESTDSAENG